MKSFDKIKKRIKELDEKIEETANPSDIVHMENIQKRLRKSMSKHETKEIKEIDKIKESVTKLGKMHKKYRKRKPYNRFKVTPAPAGHCEECGGESFYTRDEGIMECGECGHREEM
jgi:hypothetical protein